MEGDHGLNHITMELDGERRSVRMNGTINGTNLNPRKLNERLGESEMNERMDVSGV